MRQGKKYRMLFGFGLAIMLCSVQAVQAQDDPPPPSTCLPGDPDYDPRLCVPIDGGLAFLLMAGVGYGVLKNRSTNRKEQNEPSTPTDI
ncbi:hypothetical protein HRG84_22940 [Flavisolibacter sp. BT320]|nr:hypothetical protein [Flavisolibacter longurius]